MSFALSRLDKTKWAMYKAEKKQLMKREAQNLNIQCSAIGHRRRWRFAPLIAFAFLALPARAHASLFQGETLDAVANGISWVVLVIGPIIGIAAFWMVHILPEKIAEKKKHPQAKAIQCVCLLSLCFGGLLWPFAWLWAYTKPVLHKMAYGTDVDESHGHDEKPVNEAQELANLRARVAELETELHGKSAGAK
jgi:CBS domain containing-hemolysin-like protein